MPTLAPTSPRRISGARLRSSSETSPEPDTRLAAASAPSGCEPLALMARRLLIVALALLALLGISQLVIPPIAEHRVEDRLTAAGGTANVSMSAFPAARLLFGDGSRITITGSGLDLTDQQESG